MTDLFDRVAAQALGLGLTLRPRTRSRYEPAGDVSWQDSAGTTNTDAFAYVTTDVAAQPAEILGQGLPTSAKRGQSDATAVGVQAADTGRRVGDAPAESLGELPTVSKPRHFIQHENPPLAAATIPPLPNVVRRSPDLSPRQEADHVGPPIQRGESRFPRSGGTARASTRSDPQQERSAPSDKRQSPAQDTSRSPGMMIPQDQSLADAVSEASGSVRRDPMTLDQEAAHARGHMVVDDAISRRAGPVVEVSRPADQHAVDVLANCLPGVFIAPAQDCAAQNDSSAATRLPAQGMSGTILAPALLNRSLAAPPPARTTAEERASAAAVGVAPDSIGHPIPAQEWLESDRQLPSPSRIVVRQVEAVKSPPVGTGPSEPRANLAAQPAIEITIGRLEVRVESAVPPRRSKLFQPRRDLAAYRAARERGG
jgi:hypothetical protein